MAASLFVLVLAGCEGGGGSTNALGPAGTGEDTTGTGTLSLMLTDAPRDDLQAVYVTIDEVQVHMADGENGGWKTVVEPDPKRTFNLLELVNGVMEQLGVGVLKEGTYTQMRLIIGLAPDEGEGVFNILGHPHPFANYVIVDDTEIPLKVPSGVQTGVKLVHPFEIKVDLATELILDFDAAKSVHKAGNSGKYILKPTIKVIGTHGVIDGRVIDADTVGLQGVRVSAQTCDDNDELGFDERNRIIFHASAETDVNGYYAMHLPPGFYCLVYYKGYSPVDENDFGVVYGPYSSTYEAFMDTYETLLDVQLDQADTGNVIVEITPDEANEDVTVSFRQGECGGGVCDSIEVSWETGTANSVPDPYTVTAGLPAGDYDVVGFTESKTRVETVTGLAAGYTETVILDFTTP
jgi:hypothetical protein